MFKKGDLVRHKYRPEEYGILTYIEDPEGWGLAVMAMPNGREVRVFTDNVQHCKNSAIIKIIESL